MSDNPDTKTQATGRNDPVSNDVCFALVEWPEHGLTEYNPPLGKLIEFFCVWYKAGGAEAANPNLGKNDDQWFTIPPAFLEKYRLESTCYGVGKIAAMHIHLSNFVDAEFLTRRCQVNDC